MKNTLFFFMLIGLLASCRGDKKQPAADSAQTIVTKVKPRTLTDEFKGIINGEWLKSDYIDEIARTQSPLKAWGKIGNITGLLIDADSIKGDSGKISINYSYHEGDVLTLKFRKGRALNAIPFYSRSGDIDNRTFELGYNIANGDTSLIVYTYNSKGKLEDKASFKRSLVNSETTNNNASDASYYLINQLVIAGNYEMTDTLNNHSIVQFKANGRVTGSDAFKKYSLNIDFMTPPNEADVIHFDATPTERSRKYIYQFNKDTLNFYRPKFDKDSMQLVVDKLQYTLVKQK